jgi:hypothetical protein
MSTTNRPRRYHGVAPEIEAELIAAWPTHETAAAIAARLDIRPRTVSSVFERLAKEGRIPSARRSHVRHPASPTDSIHVGDDILLQRLTNIHGGD